MLTLDSTDLLLVIKMCLRPVPFALYTDMLKLQISEL